MYNIADKNNMIIYTKALLIDVLNVNVSLKNIIVCILVEPVYCY